MLVTVVAALVVVIGGAFAAAGQIGALGDHATSASPSDGPVTDDATDDVTEDESTEAETDASTEDEGSDGEDSGAAEPKAPCALTSPPNRAAGGTDAERHPGWSTGRHLGWCVAAAHHHTTGRPANPGSVGGEKHADKPARPAVKAHKKPHPGKGHAKHH